jgi:hypothetical protein
VPRPTKEKEKDSLNLANLSHSSINVEEFSPTVAKKIKPPKLTQKTF